MTTNNHIYTAQELRQVTAFDIEVTETLERVSQTAYTAASHGYHSIACVARADVARHITGALEQLGYTVIIMREDNLDEGTQTSQPLGVWLRIEW